MRYLIRGITRFIQICRGNCIKILAALVCIFVMSIIYADYMQKFNYAAYRFSAADFLMLSWLPFFRCILLTPVFLILVLSLNHYDFMVNKVIRYKSMQNVWLEQITRNTLFTAALSFIISILIVCIGCGTAAEWVDFDDGTSLFAFMNDGTVIVNPPFIRIFLLFWLCLFLYMLLLDVFFLLFWWLISNSAAAMLLTYMWSVTECYTMKKILIFNRVGVGYDRWVVRDFHIFSTAIIIFGVILIGMKTAERKELLNGGK